MKMHPNLYRFVVYPAMVVLTTMLTVVFTVLVILGAPFYHYDVTKTIRGFISITTPSYIAKAMFTRGSNRVVIEQLGKMGIDVSNWQMAYHNYYRFNHSYRTLFNTMVSEQGYITIIQNLALTGKMNMSTFLEVTNPEGTFWTNAKRQMKKEKVILIDPAPIRKLREAIV